jgi:undecaprenyl-diphosphatase
VIPNTPERLRLSPHKWIERDRSWARAMHRATARAAVRPVLAGVSWLSDGIVWYATMLVLPWLPVPNATACSLRMALLGLIDLAIYRILKRHFARPRPFVSCPDVHACARCLDEHSFPSGHVLHAVAFGTMLCTYYPPLVWIVWPFVALVAASRVVLGLHYPSDVVVGAVLGWFMATSVLVLF